MAIVARYKGDGGAFYNGVPARDLDESDWARLDDAQKALVREGDLYSLAERRATAAEAKADKGKEG